MKTQEKKNYSAPALTVVSFVMERGFAGSNNTSIESNTVNQHYQKDDSQNTFWD